MPNNIAKNEGEHFFEATFIFKVFKVNQERKLNKADIAKRGTSDRFCEIRSGPNVILAVQSGNTRTNYSIGPVALPITSRYTKS